MIAVILAGVVGSACADSHTAAPLSPDRVAARATAAAVQADESAALETLTQAVAMAMQDQGLRQRVKNDMRHAQQLEHKLDLAPYLNGNGGILLAKMAQQSGRSRAELLELLARVRPLEFYMPVPAHREAWTGGADLLVAGRLGEDQAPVGFTLAGARTALDARTPPATPTLVLVPRETDFAKTVNPAHARNEHDKDGQSIGTLVVVDPCATDGSVDDVCTGGGGGGGTYTPPPAGIYFTEMVIYDNNEPWSSGSPEIEVHMVGSKRGVTRTVTDPYGGTSTRFFPDEYELMAFDCAGAKASPAIRNFDFNDEGGAHHYQTVLFAEQPKFTVTEFVVTPTAQFRREVPMEPPYLIKVLERDDGRECPVAERKTKSETTYSLNALAGSWSSLASVQGFNSESIRYLLNGGNDPMGEWTVGSYAQLEGFSGTWLPRRTDDPEIDDVIIRVSNLGFTHTTLPAFTAFSF